MMVPLALFAFGCDDRPTSGPVPVHPVSGFVTYKNKPLSGALVAFHASGGSNAPKTGEAPSITTAPNPTGMTDQDGKFKLHSFVGDDGAPIGDYTITVSLARTSETRDVMVKATTTALVVSIPAKYADPAQSSLTATVKEGPNEIPTIELR